MVVVINVREEIGKFEKKVKNRTLPQTVSNDIFFLLAELVSR